MHDNDKVFYMGTLIHPSFVHGAKFYPDNPDFAMDRKIVATACYDKKIRIYRINLDY